MRQKNSFVISGMKTTFLLGLVVFVSGCGKQKQDEIEIVSVSSSSFYLIGAKKSLYNIDELKASAPEKPVDISGEWRGIAKYSTKIGDLKYKLVIENKNGKFIPASFSRSGLDIKLDIRNFQYKHPILSFEADNGMLDPNGGVPDTFIGEFVVFVDEIKGHFREVKTKSRDGKITYYNFDTDFTRER